VDALGGDDRLWLDTYRRPTGFLLFLIMSPFLLDVVHDLPFIQVQFRSHNPLSLKFPLSSDSFPFQFCASLTDSDSDPINSSSYSSSSSASVVGKYSDEEQSLRSASRLCSKRSSSGVSDEEDVGDVVENSDAFGVEGAEERRVKTVKGR